MKNREFWQEFEWNGSFWSKFSGKKEIPFEVFPFSRFYDQNFLYHLFGLHQCQASYRKKAKILPVFCKWYNSIPVLFSVPKKYQYHLTEVFHRNFLTNGKRSRLRNAWFPITIQFRFLETVFVVIFFKTMCNKTIIRFDFCDILNNQGLGKCYQPRPSTPQITPLLISPWKRSIFQLVISDANKTYALNFLLTIKYGSVESPLLHWHFIRCSR